MSQLVSISTAYQLLRKFRSLSTDLGSFSEDMLFTRIAQCCLLELLSSYFSSSS